MNPNIWHKVTGFSGVAALGLGTYGSHGFKPKNPTYKEVWQTASLYHLVHTAALASAPFTKHPHIFGGLLTAGIVAFSGTCYTVAFLEDRKYSRLAPFGGFAFIAAWGSLLFYCYLGNFQLSGKQKAIYGNLFRNDNEQEESDFVGTRGSLLPHNGQPNISRIRTRVSYQALVPTKFGAFSSHLHHTEVKLTETMSRIIEGIKNSIDVSMWLKFAAFSGILAVGLGAFGTHVFKPQNLTYKEVWQTASLYHLVHTAAILATPIIKRPHVFGGLMAAGILTFSGSCYTAAYLEDRKYSFLAPFGGFAFVAGWASLLFQG